MKIVILGTSSVFPTKERNHSAILIRYGSEGLLFDCGEGTQRQFTISGESIMKVSKIFISHWHGDHILGLPGLIQSLTQAKRTRPLEIYGPKGTKTFFSYLLKSFSICEGSNQKCMQFPIKIKEIVPKAVDKICEKDEYEVYATKLDHFIPCLGFAFQEKGKRKINLDYLKKFGLGQDPILKKLQDGKDIRYKGKLIKASKATIEKPGKKVSYAADTGVCDNLVRLAMDSDVFICESTFMSDHKDMAKERKHLTAKQAAKIAKKAKVKKLILTHFSQRYKNLLPLLREARQFFKNTVAAKDFLEIKL